MTSTPDKEPPFYERGNDILQKEAIRSLMISAEQQIRREAVVARKKVNKIKDADEVVRAYGVNLFTSQIALDIDLETFDQVCQFLDAVSPINRSVFLEEGVMAAGRFWLNQLKSKKLSSDLKKVAITRLQVSGFMQSFVADPHALKRNK